MSKKTPYPLCAEITHWASGGIVQWLEESSGQWIDCDKLAPPVWNSSVTYRIKVEPEKEYPKSSLSYGDLCGFMTQAAHYKKR